MQNISNEILIYIVIGLSIFIFAWALFVKVSKKNFVLDLPKIFVTSSVTHFKSSLLKVTFFLALVVSVYIFKDYDHKDLFKGEFLLLMVPIVLSFIIIYFIEPLSRKK